MNSEMGMNYLNATDYCPAAGTSFRESGGERGWCQGMNTARRVLDWGGGEKEEFPTSGVQDLLCRSAVMSY